MNELTPRTDKAAFQPASMPPQWNAAQDVVQSGFARQLERELIEATKLAHQKSLEVNQWKEDAERLANTLKSWQPPNNQSINTVLTLHNKLLKGE